MSPPKSQFPTKEQLGSTGPQGRKVSGSGECKASGVSEKQNLKGRLKRKGQTWETPRGG